MTTPNGGNPSNGGNSSPSIVITREDALRTGVLSIVTSGMSVLVLLNLVTLDASQLAGITAFASNAIALLFLFWKPRSQTTPVVDPAALQAIVHAEIVSILAASQTQTPAPVTAAGTGG